MIINQIPLSGNWMKVSTRIPYPQVFLNELDIVKEYGYRLEIEFM